MTSMNIVKAKSLGYFIIWECLMGKNKLKSLKTTKPVRNLSSDKSKVVDEPHGNKHFYTQQNKDINLEH